MEVVNELGAGKGPVSKLVSRYLERKKKKKKKNW